MKPFRFTTRFPFVQPAWEQCVAVEVSDAEGLKEAQERNNVDHVFIQGAGLYHIAQNDGTGTVLLQNVQRQDWRKHVEPGTTVPAGCEVIIRGD